MSAAPSARPPRVSVVMPIYKVEAYVEASVRSVLRQSLEDFELIGVDDASPDGSAARFLACGDARLRIVRHESNRGLAAARNSGMAAARGQYVALLDSDDLATPLRLARQVAFLDRNSDVVLCGGHMRFIDPSGRAYGRVHRAECDSERIAPSLALRNPFFVSTVMFRRSLAQRIAYRTDFAMAEDYEFYLRAAQFGRLANLDALLLLYRQHPASLTSTRPALMAQFVERIQRRQLFEFGVVPNARQMALHRHLTQLNLPPAESTLEELEDWLQHLLARVRAARGEAPAWPVVLGNAWFEVCSHASSLGAPAWRRYWRSPLSAAARPPRLRLAKFWTKAMLRIDRAWLARRPIVGLPR